MTLPKFGLGTFRLQGDTVIHSVTNALDLGYRAIDTAQAYDNEEAIGIAIKNSGISSDSIYLTTKIWVDNLSKEKLIPSLKASLKKIKCRCCRFDIDPLASAFKPSSCRRVYDSFTRSKKIRPHQKNRGF